MSAAREARVEAQAKINLFLRILEREESGYHQLETLFCRIALADTITVTLTGGERTLDCFGERMPAAGLGPVDRNLAWRAAASYADLTGFPSGYAITIEKRIPVGGGLGGGSADAGGVLRVLNALNPRPIGAYDLLQLAASLGADVPFLTQDQSALALGWGRGDRLAALPNLPSSALWLLVPDVSVNTAEAYRWLDEAGLPPGRPVIKHAELASWEGVAAIATNDFERVVGERIPRIQRLLAALRSEEIRQLLGPSGFVLMSGSGSAIAVVSGAARPLYLDSLPSFAGVTVTETETATFVEQVVLTH